MYLRRAVLTSLFAAFFMVAFSPVYASSVGDGGHQIQDYALQQQLQYRDGPSHHCRRWSYGIGDRTYV